MPSTWRGVHRAAVVHVRNGGCSFTVVSPTDVAHGVNRFCNGYLERVYMAAAGAGAAGAGAGAAAPAAFGALIPDRPVRFDFVCVALRCCALPAR